MSTSSAVMSTLLSGLTTYQAAISVTSSNIANAEAEGYTRQSATIQSVSSSSGGLSGVEVSEVVRATDRFCFSQVVDSQDDLGKFETEDKYMSYVEAIFDESEGSGINEALSDFWNSWQDIVNDPSGYAERVSVVSNAQTLCGNLNNAVDQLEAVQGQIDDEISATVEEINILTSQIAKLNSQIAKAEAQGNDTNTLLDSLDQAVEELSVLVDVNVTYSDDGQASIQLSDGKSLVSGGRSYSLSTEMDASTGNLDICWNDESGNSTVINDVIDSGALGGCLEVRDELIPSYIDDLNSLAETLIQEVNSLLQSGYDLNGDPGTDLFTGTGAGDIAVNESVVADVNLIAAAADADAVSGDATIAMAVVELQSENLMNSGTSSMDDFYQDLVSTVGVDTESVSSSYEQAENLSVLYQNYMESVTGVSVDEETANLVLYQQAYEASAKVMSVLQELMDTVLEL